ncbi:MAG TPA: hypothetical protein VHZ56_11275 [Devosia sp.]|jgi:hypothetical protein|nr:hypothetical protein [Devosia sp.]
MTKYGIAPGKPVADRTPRLSLWRFRRRFLSIASALVAATCARLGIDFG